MSAMEEEYYYRWLLIDNQETCYKCVVKVLDGYFKDKEQVEKAYEKDYCFREYLFSLEKLEATATPKWLVEKIQ